MQAVDEYLDGLARELFGPRRVRAELLTEARHSLQDASEAYADAGLAPDEAADRAVAEFGSYDEVAPAFQEELAAVQGRRTALLIAISLPVLYLFTSLLWRHGPWQGQAPSHGFLTLADTFDRLALAGAAIFAVAWLGYGRASRFAPDGRRLARLVGLGSLSFLAVHGLAGAAVFGWGISLWPHTLTWPPVLAGVVVMWGGFGYATWCAWRCVRASRAAFSSVPAAA